VSIFQEADHTHGRERGRAAVVACARSQYIMCGGVFVCGRRSLILNRSRFSAHATARAHCDLNFVLTCSFNEPHANCADFNRYFLERHRTPLLPLARTFENVNNDGNERSVTTKNTACGGGWHAESTDMGHHTHNTVVKLQIYDVI
jgi:hypothetical protein